MTRNNQCIKCGSKELLRIPMIPGEEPHIVVGEGIMHTVPVTKYVCGQCGYIEEWVENEEDLGRLRKEYADE